MRINADQISVTIVRFGQSTVNISVPKDSTLEEVLRLANISLAPGENVYFNGEKAPMDATAEDGDSLQIIGKKEGGSK